MAKAAPAEQLKLLELQGLDAKLKSLANRRRSLENDPRSKDLEDIELEVMERLDSLRARQAAQQGIVDDIQGSFGTIRAELDAELAEVEAEASGLRTRRAEFAAGLDAGLLAVYEKTLAKRGVGAARLFHGTSEASGMKLSPGDLAEIKAAAADDIVFCPDSGAILVRSEEWA